MRNRFRASIIVIAVAAAAAIVSLAATRNAGQARASQARRAADGKPDFSGIWQANNTAHWDLQTHVALPARVMQAGVHPLSPVPAAPVLTLGAVGGVPGGLGVVEGDEIPYQPWALAKRQHRRAQRG